MLKSTIGAVAALVLLSGAALADQMEAAYGNTVVITDGKGAVTKWYGNADGTWTQTTPAGATETGTWTMKDPNTACFTMTEPAPGPDYQPNCADVAIKRAVGDKWVEGEGEAVVNYEIVAGR